MLRRHWLTAALLAAGLALRVAAQLAYRPALFYIDTPRYLYNAGGMDPVGYKGFLLAVLTAGGFGAVAAVQHLLGLAMAVVLYALLLRRGAPRWLAARRCTSSTRRRQTHYASWWPAMTTSCARPCPNSSISMRLLPTRAIRGSWPT